LGDPFDDSADVAHDLAEVDLPDRGEAPLLRGAAPATRWATSSSVLLGTQPKKVQSPPGALCSTSATRRPALRAVRAAASPVAPAPITIRS